MEPDQTEIIVILTYVSVLIEIIVFPVPSVASSFQLILREKSLPSEFLFNKVQKLNLWQKILLLAFPSLLSVIAFCTPLILIVISKFSDVSIDKTEKTELIIIAFLLILTGRIISLYSVMNIRKNNHQKGQSFDLKTSNIFSFSRNPILLGLYISFIGMIILFPKWVMLLAFGYYVVHMHFRILIEESFLKYKFGNKYEKYQYQTKRYF